MRWGCLCILLAAAGANAAPLNVCLVSGSFEYDSDTSLAGFQQYLESQYAVECTLLKAASMDELPGLEALDRCDVALFFTRRLTIQGEALDRVKRYCSSGKPLVAVRTASHGFQHWLEFDRLVLGGNYHGHLEEGPTTNVQVVPEQKDHPILQGVGEIRSRYSLYQTKALTDDTCLLLEGRTPKSKGSQPLAWTREVNGGRVFYTSLGGVGDFDGGSCRRMLANALFWTARRAVERKEAPVPQARTPKEGVLAFPVRTRTESSPKSGVWQENSETVELPAAETALLICDMWDRHWCDFACERVADLAPRVDKLAEAARAAGVLIIHAPSETLGFYTDTAPRRRMLMIPHVAPPEEKPIKEPRILPVNDSDGGCPGPEKEYIAWTRQHAAIRIADEDVISDNGEEIYSLLRAEGIKNILYTGVHANMCVIGRSFGIRQMTKWGINCFLVRDLTDTMYNPAMPPQVPHDEGTELVVQHIEKYLCPSVLAPDLLRAMPRR